MNVEADSKVKKTFSSVWVPPDLQDRIKTEAARVGIPWTRMLCVLASEAMDNRKGRT